MRQLVYLFNPLHYFLFFIWSNKHFSQTTVLLSGEVEEEEGENFPCIRSNQLSLF